MGSPGTVGWTLRWASPLRKKLRCSPWSLTTGLHPPICCKTEVILSPLVPMHLRASMGAGTLSVSFSAAFSWMQ